MGTTEKNEIVAVLGNSKISNAKNYGDTKETIETLTVVAFKDGEFRHPITARLYMGRSNNASLMYCSIWISAGDYCSSGRGVAGGGGYRKQSAALDGAISSAGITLSRSIDGAGASAMRDALTAIARSLGFDQTTIV